MLTPVASEEIAFGPNGSDYRWVDVQSFRFVDEPQETELLAALLGHRLYAHSYAEPRHGLGPETGEMHGPYRLEALSPKSFVPTTGETASAAIRCWAGQYGVLVPEVAGAIEAMIAQHLAPATSVHRLPDLRSTAEHEWGWVVGVDGFEEFVAIDRSRGLLSLVVCGDD